MKPGKKAAKTTVKPGRRRTKRKALQNDPLDRIDLNGRAISIRDRFDGLEKLIHAALSRPEYNPDAAPYLPPHSQAVAGVAKGNNAQAPTSPPPPYQPTRALASRLDDLTAELRHRLQYLLSKTVGEDPSAAQAQEATEGYGLHGGLEAAIGRLHESHALISSLGQYLGTEV